MVDKVDRLELEALSEVKANKADTEQVVKAVETMHKHLA